MASGIREGEVIYEVKLPLTRTDARLYAVGAAPGGTIGLGLATPESPRDLGRRQRLVGSSGMIGGNPYYGGANGGGFAPSREDDGRVKPLSLWTPLKLATN
jgi:hypothetical protein